MFTDPLADTPACVGNEWSAYPSTVHSAYCGRVASIRLVFESLEFRIACLLAFLGTATLSLSFLASFGHSPPLHKCEISTSNWPMRAAMWRPTHHTYARQISPFPRFFLLLFSTYVGALHGICPRLIEHQGRGERRTKRLAFVSHWERACATTWKLVLALRQGTRTVS